MAANIITASALIKTVRNGGRTITIKYVTKTDKWERSFLGDTVKENFSKAIEKANVPASATIAILTRTEHKSHSDNRTHFTTIYQDKDGKHVSTRHVKPLPKSKVTRSTVGLEVVSQATTTPQATTTVKQLIGVTSTGECSGVSGVSGGSVYSGLSTLSNTAHPGFPMSM